MKPPHYRGSRFGTCPLIDNANNLYKCIQPELCYTNLYFYIFFVIYHWNDNVLHEPRLDERVGKS